jgi:hypothetical protein
MIHEMTRAEFRAAAARYIKANTDTKWEADNVRAAVSATIRQTNWPTIRLVANSVFAWMDTARVTGRVNNLR